MASQFIGRQQGIGITPEATRGTAEESVLYWLPHLELGFDNQADKIFDESAVGTLDQSRDSAIEATYAEGNISGPVEIDSLPVLLWNLFGDLASAANDDTSGSVYDHTLTHTDEIDPKALSIFKNSPVRTQVHANGMMSNWEFTAELGEYIQYSADVIAKSGESSGVTKAYVAQTKFTPKHISYKLANSVSGLDAAEPVAKVQSFTLTNNPNTERDHEHGQNDPYDITRRAREITGTITIRYTDATLEDAFLNDDKRALEVTLENEDVDIGDSEHPRVVFTLPLISLESRSKEQGNADPVEQEFEFRALMSLEEAYSLQAVVTNTVDSYTA